VCSSELVERPEAFVAGMLGAEGEAGSTVAAPE